MPDQSLTQTPDMQAAGVPGMPEPMSQGGLMDALRSRGTPPSSLAQTLAPTQGANVGLGFGSGVLNALSGGNAALNPYLAQQQQQQNLQRREIARMQERQEALRERQEEAYMKIVEGLKDSSDPGARDTYAREMSRYSGRLGRQPISPEYFKQAAKLSEQELAHINQDIVANLSPAQIAARNPKVATMDPQWLPSQIQVLKSPLVRKKMGFADDEELKLDRVKRERETAEAETATWLARHPEVQKEDVPYVAAVAKRSGVSLDQLDDKGIADATKFAEDERRRIERTSLQGQNILSQINAREMELGIKQRAQALAEQTKAQMGAGGDIPGFERKVQFKSDGTTSTTYTPRTKPIENIASLQQTRTILAQIEDLSKKLMTEKDAVSSNLKGGKLYLGALTRSNTDAANYSDSTESFLGVISRTLGGERGVLTDRDVIRIRQMMPGFRDTVAIRDQKMAFIKKMLDTAEIEQRKIWQGDAKPTGPSPQGPQQGTPLKPGVRRIKVRDNKTGKTHWAELGAGDIVPPGYTEIP